MKRLSSIRMATVLFAALALLATACSSSDSSDTTAAVSTGNTESTVIVKEIQTTLKALGYDTGPVDGVFGASTVAALEDFQSDAGITVDGKYGPDTHEALEKAAIEQGLDWDKQAIITGLQQEMADLGYYDGPIDGEYGTLTENAVKAVQADCNIEQDGIFGPDTHSCLLDLGGDA
jgi:peptidoglycan hydrolase-like protein with peptidoglycan-binding domain